MKNITVIGAGTMGNGIAHVFAQSGFNVNLVDVSQTSLEKGLATIAANLDRMLAKEKITADDKAATLANITTYTSIDEGVKMVDGPLNGLLARAIVVINDNGDVVYTELVPEIVQEPSYEGAINAVKG